MSYQLEMCDAIMFGDIEYLSHLLSNSTDPNFKLNGVISPLSLAVHFRNTTAIKLLMKYGAYPEVEHGSTSLLHDAVIRGDAEAVETLLGMGSYPNDVFYENGMTPLHLATKFKSLNIIETLLENKADPDIVNTYKATPLHLAVMLGDMDMTNLLIKYNATLDNEDCYGCTPLLHAVVSGNVDICKCLLDNGANPNYISRNCDVALLCAVVNNKSDIVRLLIDRGADCNIMVTIRGESSCTILDILKSNYIDLKIEAIYTLIAEIIISTYKKTRPISFEGFVKNFYTIATTKEFLEIFEVCKSELVHIEKQIIGKKNLYEICIMETIHQQNENVLARNVRKILNTYHEIRLYRYRLKEVIKTGVTRLIMIEAAINAANDEISKDMSKWSILPYEIKYLIVERIKNEDLRNILS